MNLPKYLLVDVDGTLWKCGKALPGIPEAISKIKKMGIQVKILTNNTTLSRKDFAERIVLCGVKGIKEKDILSSSYCCALIMKRMNIKTTYVSSFSGLKEELKLQNITVYDHSSSDRVPKVDAITVSNPRCYPFDAIIQMATIYKRSPKCLLFAANPDATNIVDGKTIPATAAFVSTIERLINKKAINVGKPSEEMMEILLEQLRCRPEEMMIVGDRLPTDIKFGAQYGIPTVFVLTGVDKASNIEELPPKLRPTFVLPSLANLPELFMKKYKAVILKTPKIKKNIQTHRVGLKEIPTHSPHPKTKQASTTKVRTHKPKSDKVSKTHKKIDL